MQLRIGILLLMLYTFTMLGAFAPVKGSHGASVAACSCECSRGGGVCRCSEHSAAREQSLPPCCEHREESLDTPVLGCNCGARHDSQGMLPEGSPKHVPFVYAAPLPPWAVIPRCIQPSGGFPTRSDPPPHPPPEELS